MERSTHHRENINQIGFDMLVLCKSQLLKAKESLINNDSDLAEEVIHNESRVNAMDIKIEKDCERYLALFNPVAIDLRFIMVVRKINSDLERIGDHAFNIAKIVVENERHIPKHLLEAVNFYEMCDTIDTMFDHITTAYDKKNVKQARKVFKKDKILDTIYLKSYSILEQEIKKDTTITREALLLFSVINKLERVGDLIENISEEIIFYIDAEILKHQNEK